MDDRVVAEQAHLRAALDHAIGNPATGNPADLGDVEGLQNARVAKVALAFLRLEQTAHQRLHVVHQLVDDRVVADVDAVALGAVARLCVGTDVEADHHGLRGAGQRDVGLGDTADALVQDVDLDLVGRQLLQGADDRLDRAVHVALDDDRQLFGRAFLERGEHGFQRALGGQRRGFLRFGLAEFSNLARPGFGLDDNELVPGDRCAVQA